MKKLSLIIATILYCVTSFTADAKLGLSENDSIALDNAVKLVDIGMPENALPQLEEIAKRNPDNYIARYEHMYALMLLKRYDDVVKIGKKLIKMKDASDLAFQMTGLALGDLGKYDEACKMYLKGLERFPDSGILYLELGNANAEQKKYEEALAYYNDGILVAPMFSSNYFRAAHILNYSSAAKVWGLVYAETEIILAPGKKDRTEIMSKQIRDCFLNCVKLDTVSPDSVSVKISLTPKREIIVDKDNNKRTYLGFPGIYEGCMVNYATELLASRQPFTASLRQLIDLRRSVVETYFSVTDNLYGNSMYLLPYQKSIIDAGHWDAYNIFLFYTVFPQEASQWLKDNGDRFDAFINWTQEHPFILDESHTVGMKTIYRDSRPLDMLGALKISAGLLKPNSAETDSIDKMLK